MMILEDDPCDILTKAMLGQGLDVHLLSKKTHLAEDTIHSVLHGERNPQVIHQLADILNLSAEALLNQGNYNLEVTPPEGLYRFISEYGYLGVNAYLIIHGQSATIFDTGTNAQSIINFIDKHQLHIDTLYITHRHADHTACIDVFPDTPIVYPEDLRHGQILTMGDIHLTAVDVSGHASSAMAFNYNGLTSPVCICGDSIFAGSIGKTPSQKSYTKALTKISDHILTLVDNTVICPGHGPLSTVLQEKSHTPFFATT